MIPKSVTDIGLEATSGHNDGYVTEIMKKRLANILLYVKQALGEVKAEKDVEGLNIGDLPAEIVNLAVDYSLFRISISAMSQKEDLRKQLIEVRDYIVRITG